MMQENKESVSKKIEKYGRDVQELARYLPWLEGKQGQDLSQKVDPGEGKQTTMQVPVYDSTLLNFIKAAQKTAFMNKNYVYTYRKYRLNSAADELKLIDNSQIMEIENIGDILSSYVMRGRTKGPVWNEGVQNGVYYHAVKRMKELLEFWSA